MIHKSILLFLVLGWCVSLAQTDGAPDDILRFKNGDKLHGNFMGFSSGSRLAWDRADLGGKIAFETTDVRQVVLNAGKTGTSRQQFSHLGTVNGDRIPGWVTRLDDDKVVLETKFGSTLEIPRERVGLIAPHPLGGRVLYHGPFVENEWAMIDMEHPEGLPLEEEDDKNPSSRWQFSGSAWYWQHESSGTALVRREGLPDRAILKFDIAWKSRLSLAIGFHSSFKRPKGAEQGGAEDEKRRGKNNALPQIFGESYVLHLYSNYLQLYRTGFDEDGDPVIDRINNVGSGELGLTDSTSATVEIRCNRLSGEVLLFVNDTFILQWVETAAVENYQGKGNGFGFLVQSAKTAVKVSEVIVAEWNGMPDAARSMQVKSSDIVLLTNGTDRFSGKVTKIEEGKLSLEGRYGDFVFPMEEIAEVRFATEDLAVAEDETSDSIKVRLQPIGRISGQPLAAPPGRIRMLNKAAGEIEIDLESAVLLEFDSAKSFMDDWNVEF